MLKDSTNLSRKLAAIGLVAGPVLLAIGSGLDPAWEDDAATYLAEVADDKGLYIAAGAIATVGTLAFLVGTLGLARLLRRGQGVSLGQAGALLLSFGLIGLTPILAFNGFDTILADADNREVAAAIYDSAEDSAPLIIYWTAFFVGGIAIGTIVLTISLFRNRVAPVWSPILLIVAFVASFIAESAILSAVSFLIFAAALSPLAARIWALSSEQWRRWAPLEESPPPGAGTPAAPVR